ncbi:hypothetical protein KY360_05415 [Candidatus Woesearchaeota archaeon]|nr:hypothetical protein [Candidatus Woesearchaeota archaeon]
MNKRMNKKSQITLFIIIGIVMLTSVGTYIYFRASIRRAEIMPELVAAEEVPRAFNPIQVFIESCVSKVGKDGMELLGSQGGYINIERAGIGPGITPTEGNAVAFSRGSGLNVPYWFYLESDNKCIGNCVFSTQKPELYKGRLLSIEGQLEEYVNANLKECFNEFKVLKTRGYIIEELGDINTKVSVTEEEVVVLVEYPIKARALDAVLELERFPVVIQVNLKDIYELAMLITNLEAEYRYLEKDALNLITGFSGKDMEKLAPMSDVGLEFGNRLYWRRGAIIDNLKGMLSAYIPLLQVEGTRNYRPLSFPGESLKESLYNQQMLIPNSELYNLDVYFTYLGWEPWFDLNCRGEICQPESISSSIITLMGLQRYNFVYDLSFPVMVEIHDPDAFKGLGYDFRFMLEANIRNNEPMPEVFSPLQVIEPQVSLLCDLEKRNSGYMDIDITDMMTAEPVDDVRVSFSCAEESCFMGIAEGGSLVERFPVCLGGIVSFLKEGYLGYSQFLNTKLDEKAEVKVTLKPLVEKQFMIKKKRVVKNPEGWVFIDTPFTLGRKESAFISLVRKPGPGEDAYQAAAEYSGGVGEITLADGDYEIDIQLYTNETIIIPEEERCEEVAFIEQCYTIEELKFNETFPNGGLKLNHTFTADDLKSDMITFYVVNTYITGIPEANRVVEDLEQIEKVEEYSTAHANRLKPTVE